MKEIGGYIEFEHYHGKEYYQDGIALNCARNALRYLIKLYQITKIYIPYYCCDVVFDVCKLEKVEVYFYHIDKKFHPLLTEAIIDEVKRSSTCFLYVINYYGQLNNTDINSFSKIVNNHIIVDNVQAFFQKPIKDINTIYTCRKFFGVPDGAYVYTKSAYTGGGKYKVDESYNRFSFLLGKFEGYGEDFYKIYNDNEESFKSSDIREMSLLTHNLLRSIDYKFVKHVRTKNFRYLHSQLKSLNKLNLKEPKGAFMYPLLVDDGPALRAYLRSKGVFVPQLWPNVLIESQVGMLEYDYARNIVPLHCDQRYSSKTLDYAISCVLNYLKS